MKNEKKWQKAKGKRQRKGFTLIEFLVVISIIAVLATILFPALSIARKKTKQAICMTNLKQVGLMILMYADDYNSYAPPYYDGDAKRTWFSTLESAGYSNWRNRDIYVCPSEYPYHFSGAATYGMVRNYNNSKPYYQHNRWVFNKMESPSKVPIVGDSYEVSRHSQYYQIITRIFYIGQTSSGYEFNLVHNGLGNMLFADGHVEALSQKGIDEINALPAHIFYGDISTHTHTK